MSVRPVVLAALMLVACSRRAAPAPDIGEKPAASLVSAPKPALHHGLSWYEDAPEAALASAKQSDKLVLVDLWAAWCHTCLSMREYVLTSENLASVRERLVFLAIDTEKEKNAALLQQLPVAAWPTFYLIASDRQVYGRWVGAASPQQLAGFVRDGLRAYDLRSGAELTANDPLALLVAADRLAARERLSEARAHYQRALAAAPAQWPRRPDTLVALSALLRKQKESAACVELGLVGMSQTGSSASATDFAYHVLDCARALDPHDARVNALRTRAEQRLGSLCSQGSDELSPDDRGDACGLLRELRTELGDTQGARAALAQRLEILTVAAADKPDAVALTYDFARVESLLALGRADEALALLTARERALPDDYNPPHYLARTYRELGRFAEGLAPVQRALAKAQGPRRAAILGVQVDLLLGAGQKADAQRVLEQQLAAYRALPPGQRQPAREEAVAARLLAWQ